MTLDVRGPPGAPVLVLLPPLGGSGDLFQPFREDLASDFRVVTSEPHSETTTLPSTRTLASRLLAELDDLQLPSFHLFGISLGGMIAQWVAIDHPARVDRLVLASTASRSPDVAQVLTLHNLKALGTLLLPDAAQRLARSIISDEVLEDPLENRRIDDALAAHPHDRAELVWLLAAAARHDARQELSTIRCPTLVLTGENDEILPASLQAELVAAIGLAEHQLIDAAAHDVTIDAPEATAQHVRRFLRRPVQDPSRT